MCAKVSGPANAELNGRYLAERFPLLGTGRALRESASASAKSGIP